MPSMNIMTDLRQIIPEGNILFGVPKKGRLYERSIELLNGSDLKHKRQARLDIATCTDMPITLVFLPAQDIAAYIGEGNLDLGITGSDVVLESGMQDEVQVSLKLGFGGCKLCVMTRIDSGYEDVASLAGKRVVTSFPQLARQFFERFETTAPTMIKYVSGSVEVACSLGLADAVVDLVETGTTMRAAGLHIIGEICNAESVLITHKGSYQSDIVKTVVKRIEGYCIAKKYRLISYNVSKDNLESILAITPGKQSATITALNDKGWYAIQALILKTDQGKIMDQLHRQGADSILIFNIANTRM